MVINYLSNEERAKEVLGKVEGVGRKGVVVKGVSYYSLLVFGVC